MKIFFLMVLLSTSSLFSMDKLSKLSSSSDLTQFLPEEIEELKQQRCATPVPSLKCLYVDKEEGDKTFRFSIAEKTGLVISCLPIYKRPTTW
jgi:hypothetical protein